MVAAACRGMDPDLFFPERGESAAEAKAVCAGCSVRAECLAYGIELNGQGVWGGTAESNRKRMRVGRRPLLVVAIDHGSLAGYAQHLRRGDPVCDSCRGAKNAFESDRRRRHRSEVVAVAS